MRRLLGGLGCFLTLFFAQFETLSAQETIYQIGKIFGGTQVLLHGEVDDVVDSNQFYLKDSTGRVEIYVGKDNVIKVKKGEVLTVRGFSSHQTVDSLSHRIVADSITFSDGTEFEFRQFVE